MHLGTLLPLNEVGLSLKPLLIFKVDGNLMTASNRTKMLLLVRRFGLGLTYLTNLSGNLKLATLHHFAILWRDGETSNLKDY